MYSRLFASTISKDKTNLPISIEWRSQLSPLEEAQLIKIHVNSFLTLYRNYSEQQLGLEAGLTKKAWLINMIKKEIEEIKAGNILLATISVEDYMAGFVTCLPVNVRLNKDAGRDLVQQWQHEAADENEWQDSFRKDVYISLLAVQSARSALTLNSVRLKEKIQIGLGRQLVESVEKKFVEANALVLDTRLINTPGIAFYKKLGFSVAGARTFGGSDPLYYTGCEKVVTREEVDLQPMKIKQ